MTFTHIKCDSNKKSVRAHRVEVIKEIIPCHVISQCGNVTSIVWLFCLQLFPFKNKYLKATVLVNLPRKPDILKLPIYKKLQQYFKTDDITLIFQQKLEEYVW